ncbi:MAG: SRPBCC family protein [Actinomycetales bacterium]|nr:SRPBCC family protein [Actinomycetales bacterium]
MVAPRAEILDTGDPRLLSARITINASAERIFSLISDPHMHAQFDGSGTVVGRVRGPDRLTLGSRFNVAMRVGVPYRVTSTVVEYEPDLRIAWCHLLGNRWRYELRPLTVAAGEPPQTEVTESDDLRRMRWFGRFSPAVRNTRFVEVAMAKTLVRLKGLAEAAPVD